MTVRRDLEWLALNRVFAWRNNTGAGWLIPANVAKKRKLRLPPEAIWIEFGKVGSGDSIGLTRYGRHLEVENKQGGGRQSPGQKTHQKMVEENGGLYFVSRDAGDLEGNRGAIVGEADEVRAYIRWLEGYLDRLERGGG